MEKVAHRLPGLGSVAEQWIRLARAKREDRRSGRKLDHTDCCQ